MILNVLDSIFSSYGLDFVGYSFTHKIKNELSLCSNYCQQGDISLFQAYQVSMYLFPKKDTSYKMNLSTLSAKMNQRNPNNIYKTHPEHIISSAN